MTSSAILGFVVLFAFIVALIWSVFVFVVSGRDAMRTSPFIGRFVTILVWGFALVIFFGWLHASVAADLKLRKKIPAPRPRPAQSLGSMPIGQAPFPRDCGGKACR